MKALNARGPAPRAARRTGPPSGAHARLRVVLPCLAEARAGRGSARGAPSATARCCATTSRASPSRPSAAWLGAAASSASRG
ncbi:hypothetical protein llap_16295 [Limosa lapponica baueri]|uniref:Uncharacterized protein n=1 Tax=Limosa lapponica baueri TaxID=1758121 RepID=A0A2I0THX5_LIMLA|nr:hypothetical protein llap_16295 [Limosa lapponica baueri]